tara:strand:+ start:11724 stop:12356 length:633 start_codon:yes stop_codon:yes gene_type:complete
MTRIYQQLDRLRDMQDIVNDQTTEREAAIVDALGETVFRDGDTISFDESIGSEYLLTAGIYPGFTVSTPHAVLRGSPGAEVTGIVKVQADCVLSGLHFKSTGEASNALRLVEVSGGARAVITNCIFERINTDDSSNDVTLGYAHLAILSGGKALASDCVFRSNLNTGVMNGVGFYVWSDAANPWNNVYINGALNLTTHLSSNAANIAVVT